MKRFKYLVAAAAFIATTLVQAGELAVGDPAPDFSLPGSDGKTHSMADYRGKQAVVIAWFPRAFTSGCTIECKSLAEKATRGSGYPQPVPHSRLTR